jgi:hypothetical protein
MIATLIYRNRINAVDVAIDNLQITVADYSVKCENIKEELRSKEALDKYFK